MDDPWFGAIMTFPLRVEYLAEEEGLNLSNAEIALIGVGIFFLFKIIGSLFWGKLFDRMHFMRYRITINLFMLVAILVYFNAPGFLGVAVGAALAGVATGGANLAWSLWVTKIAPPGRVSEYMGVHMSFTGIRGATAPFMGYALVEPLGLLRSLLSFQRAVFSWQPFFCYHPQRDSVFRFERRLLNIFRSYSNFKFNRIVKQIYQNLFQAMKTISQVTVFFLCVFAPLQ